ncbi:site-specific DNA-methyltransferase [Streptomyces sp. G35A]
MTSNLTPRHRGRLELTWTNKDKTLLSTGDGKYDYTFVDPSDYRVSEVRLLHEVAEVKARTPEGRPAELPEPTSDNLLITGDAMHVLDALAKIPAYAEKYLGRVKLVYIDPPFNTGQAFEHYEDNIEHSIWLTLLRDRLRQIKPLLAEDGTVWVHLDDVEVHRCRAVMDEELGPENFVAEVIWQKAYSPRNDTKAFSTDQDYILVYSKKTGWGANRLPRLAERDVLYVSPDGDPRPWVSGDPAAPGGSSHQGMVYGIQSPFTGKMFYPAHGRHWSAAQSTMKALAEEWGVKYEWRDIGDTERRAAICDLPPDEVRAGVPALMVVGDLNDAAKVAEERLECGVWPRLYFTKGGQGGLKLKRYLDDIASDRAPQTLWFHEEVGHNRSAKAEIKSLVPGVVPFATPKPERLLQRIIHIATNPGDIVLDCFAGSGTTAAVAHKMGRRWVTSELIATTVETFTKPRLAKVVRGEDPGGITTVTERVATGSLPDGMTPLEAQEFNRLLNKVAKTSDAFNAATLRDLRAATKTQDKKTTIWHGGGGFTHLLVGESMFIQMDDMTLLADWATQGALAEAMCAQLSVPYRPEGIFAAKQGRARYVIIDGMVGEGTIAAILDRLAEGEVVEVWATQIEDGAAETLTAARRGSRLELIPDKVLDNYRRKSARKAPFGVGRSEPPAGDYDEVEASAKVSVEESA